MDHGGIFRQAADLLASGHCVALATVTETVGSTPGKVGYKMLIVDCPPELVGTVGGGAVEGDTVRMARGMLGRRACRVVRYNLDTTRKADMGICGGQVELLIESFDASDAPFFKAVAAAWQQGEDAAVASVLESDAVPEKALIVAGELRASTGAGGRLRRGTNHERQSTKHGIQNAIDNASSDAAALTIDDTGKVVLGDTLLFIEKSEARPHLVIFGAGHLGGFLARYAAGLGFRVTVLDDRPQYANAERLPDADEIVVSEFDNAVQAAGLDQDGYAVVVTRGHVHDEVVLEQCLAVGPKYVGMIGSKRKTAAILANLRNKGIPPSLLDTVYSPIGLAIGAVTPQEIALSIAAELVKIRRAGPDAAVTHMSSHGVRHD